MAALDHTQVAPDSTDDVSIEQLGGVPIRIADQVGARFDWKKNPALVAAANDEHPLETLNVAGGATVNPTKMQTYVVLDTDTANDWAEGTVNTDPQDATSMTLGSPTVAGQRVYVKRSGEFVGVVNSTVFDKDGVYTALEAYEDNRTLEFLADLPNNRWKDVTAPVSSGGGTGTGTGSTTLLGLTDTDSAFTANALWSTNPAGTGATQITVLDGGTY